MTSEARSVEGPARASTRDDGLVAPDVQVDGRRILLTPHNCFACGQLNVHGLQLDLHAGDDRCWTELVLPDRFEGWEGVVHGGVIATILDEVMGWAIIGTDVWGVTARMTVEYKRPVLVGGRYRAEAWVVRARRRLVESAARLVDLQGGDVVATAQALYVAVPDERKRELKARYAYTLLPGDPSAGTGTSADTGTGAGTGTSAGNGTSAGTGPGEPPDTVDPSGADAAPPRDEGAS